MIAIILIMDFKNLTYDELCEILEKFNKPNYIAKNIYSWVYKRNISDFNLMTDIAKNLREYFSSNYSISFLKADKVLKSNDNTHKFLFKLEDNNFIESVLIPHEKRLTLCISSQVGCKMNCAFCKTGEDGFIRNLKVNEIVNQIHTVNYLASSELGFKTDDSNFRAITNLVFMGMGEPLDNIEAVIKAISIVNNDNAFGIGNRKITVSTCGIPFKMKEFKLKCSAKLALSLNASNDALRNKLMPINKTYNIKNLIDTIKSIDLKPHDFITIEYILFENLNSKKEDALELANLLKGLKVKVNLLKYNKVNSNDLLVSPSDNTVFKFNEILNSNNIITRIRESRGLDINAACGQLSNLKGLL